MCVSPTSATPTVPSTTPSPGLYATPTVTATSSPTDPTTTAGAPFPLAPIVAPVVAIIILLLLAAVLVIVLVLGCKYGRKLNRKKRVNQNPYIEQSEVLGVNGMTLEGPGNHPQPVSGYSLVQYSTEDDSVAITDERTANTGGGGGGTAQITDDIQFDMDSPNLIGEGNVMYAQLATVSDRQRPIAPPPLDTKVVYSVIKPQPPPVNRNLKPQGPVPPVVNRNLKPTALTAATHILL